MIHKESDECEINHTENSGLMESAAAVIIFKRSEQKSKLRFTSMLGDGDTKTIASVNEAKPYGAGVVVKKEECIGHVAKRFYKRLERVRSKRVKNPKGSSRYYKRCKWSDEGKLGDDMSVLQRSNLE